MAGFIPFAKERMMSKWENVVDYNLGDSGVQPITLHELVDDPAMLRELKATELNYVQANGTIALRERIAALYPGADPDNVLVTVGCSEANFVSLQTLLLPGDEMVVMLPNFLQIWGVGHNSGFLVKAFHLREDLGWAPDLDELSAVVSDKTRLIAVCNPNSPTGYILTEREMDAIVAVADRAGAWLISDEVYIGAERLVDAETPSFWGRYDKVLVTSSLSKAYGLPGLRTGWVVGPVDIVDDIWARHEYTVISGTMLADKLATLALSPEVRPRLIQRARDFVRRGYAVLEEWLEQYGKTFTVVPPQAAAIALMRYHIDMNSAEFVERLIREKRTLIVPGDHFGLDGYLRVSFGRPREYVRAGLERVRELIAELQG